MLSYDWLPVCPRCRILATITRVRLIVLKPGTGKVCVQLRFVTAGAAIEAGSVKRAPFRGGRDLWKPAMQGSSVASSPLERRSTSADLGAGECEL